MDAKLYSADDDDKNDIQMKCKATLKESANRVVEHLLDQVIFDDKDIFEYFEPLLTSFLTPPVEEGEDNNNHHCTYTGSAEGPDFILKEQKLLDAKLSADQKKAGYVTLMHANAMSLSSSSSSSLQGGQAKAQRGQSSGLGGGGGGGGQGSFLRGSGGGARRGGIKSVSLTQVGCCMCSCCCVL